MLPFIKNFESENKQPSPQLNIPIISKKDSQFKLKDGEYQFDCEWVTENISKNRRLCEVLRKKTLDSSLKIYILCS